jgi:hypothetical protein
LSTAVARLYGSVLITILLPLACPAASHAQQQTMRDVLSFLVTNQAVPTADLIRDQQAAEATRDTLADALLTELAALPIATSSGAFTYRFNPTLGTLDRLAESFGPFLVDRAVTTGRGQVSITGTYRYAPITSLDGRSLRDGTFVTTANRFSDEPAPFDVEALTLRASTSTVTILGNVGVTNWLDVGAAVPLVRLEMSGERVNTYRGTSVVQARATGSATGFGDVALRAKARVAGSGVSGVAAGFELRLPTGDPLNLIGAGESAYKLSVIGSVGQGPVDAHINGAVLRGGVSEELSASAALAFAVVPRVTVSAETIIRRVKEIGQVVEVSSGHPLLEGVETIRLLPAGSNAVTTVVVPGVRWNLGSTFLLNAHVIVPLTSRGLRTRPVPTVSVDYLFAR